mgnify:CR=1 FL=1
MAYLLEENMKFCRSVQRNSNLVIFLLRRRYQINVSSAKSILFLEELLAIFVCVFLESTTFSSSSSLCVN